MVEARSLLRPAARISAASSVLTRHWDGLDSDSRRRLLYDLDEAAERIRTALMTAPADVDGDLLDEVLAVRCSIL